MAAGALQALLVWALITGLAVGFVQALPETVERFALVTLPKVDAPPPALRAGADRVRRAPAPPGRRAEASPVVALVSVPIPAPVVAAPVPARGVTTTQGAAIAGTGSGAGGQGNGLGAGGDGEGDGTGAEWVKGAIKASDYPRDLIDRRRGGTVGIRFTVGTDGRVNDCNVTRSSGSAELDALTCGLIVKRFRYRPARDAAGRAVPDVIEGDHVWEVVGPPPDPDDG